MKRKKKSKTPPVLKNDHIFIPIFLMVVVVPIVVILIIISYFQRRLEENLRLIEEYPNKIEAKLEEKYQKEFVIDSAYRTYDSGAIVPGQYHLGPYRYQAYAKEDPDYIFQACVYPKSEKNNTILKIKDSYCWQFLREQIRQYLLENAKDGFPDKYKLIIDTQEDTDFGDNVFAGCPTRYYFSSPFEKPVILVSVILPPALNGYEEQTLKEEIYPVLEEFYQENGRNMALKVIYSYTETEEAFVALDSSKRERETIPLKEIFAFTIGDLERE